MITFTAYDRASGRAAILCIRRESFLAWLRALGKTRIYDAIFAAPSGRLQ